MSYYHLCFDRVSAMTQRLLDEMEAGTTHDDMGAKIGSLFVYAQVLSILRTTLPPGHVIDEDIRALQDYLYGENFYDDGAEHNDSAPRSAQDFDETWAATIASLGETPDSDILGGICEFIEKIDIPPEYTSRDLLEGAHAARQILASIDSRSLSMAPPPRGSHLRLVVH